VKCFYPHAQSKFSFITYDKHKHTKPKLNNSTHNSPKSGIQSPGKTDQQSNDSQTISLYSRTEPAPVSQEPEPAANKTPER